MIDTPQPDSVAASVVTAAIANPNPTSVPLVAENATTPSYKALAQTELSKIKISVTNLESHISNISGDVSDEVMGAVKKLDSYAKNTTFQSLVLTGAIVAFIFIEIVKKLF